MKHNTTIAKKLLHRALRQVIFFHYFYKHFTSLCLKEIYYFSFSSYFLIRFENILKYLAMAAIIEYLCYSSDTEQPTVNADPAAASSAIAAVISSIQRLDMPKR